MRTLLAHLSLAFRAFRAFAVLVAVAALVTVAGGCGGKGANAPKRDLPPYSGHAAELFDDVIEPRSVGLSLDTPSNAKADPMLRERTQVSDAVLHVQVATMSSKNEDTGVTYTIGFRVLEKLAGNASPGEEFSVKLGKSSPSVGLVRNFEERLVGKKVVIFVRAFAVGQGEEADLHFHVVPDSKEELDAIHSAALLAEMK
jgi:hypothetical protein